MCHYSTFFSFSRLCWSFDLTWRSWNFKSFPINGKVSFSPLSIMVLAASNTYKEARLLGRVTLCNLGYSLSVRRGQRGALRFLIFVLMQGQDTAGQIHAREMCPGPPRFNPFIINLASGKGVNSHLGWLIGHAHAKRVCCRLAELVVRTVKLWLIRTI